MTSDPGRSARLLADIQAWAAALAERNLAPDAALAPLRDTLARSRGERLDVPDDPLLVAMLCGPTAVGKSSLINALAGAEISRTGLGATTAAAVVYVHERDDPARLFEYSESLGQLGREAASLVRHDRDALRHMVLVDTPDIDSVLERHREITGALVHCADLVFFVTSPEKYKVMQSAHWVAEQRGQRGIAFVLNKWDRFSFGPQYERRSLVASDFQALLADEGFENPLTFKVSALPDLDGADNDLGALRTFVEKGLDRSTAVAIQDRRRRAAWGRLGAAIAPAVPAPFAGHPFLGEVASRLAATRTQAQQAARAEALSAVADGLDGSTRPTTPGLLGGWMAFTARLGTIAAGARALMTWRGALGVAGPAARETPAAIDAGRFGAAAARLLSTTTVRLLARNDETASLPLGPVGRQWAAASSELGERLGETPLAVEAELIAGAARPSLRRTSGLAALVGVELLLAAVLLLALWRVGVGFAVGTYLPGAMLEDGAALVVVLLLIGQMLAHLFFPALQDRHRRLVAERADRLVEDAWRQAQAVLDTQVETASRLAQDGRALLTRIDEMVRSFGASDLGGVQRLFGTPATPISIVAPAETSVATTEAPRRPPVFD